MSLFEKVLRLAYPTNEFFAFDGDLLHEPAIVHSLSNAEACAKYKEAFGVKRVAAVPFNPDKMKRPSITLK